MIEGYASIFEIVDEQKDIIKKGAFSESLKHWKSQKLPMLWQHDSKTPIGFWHTLHQTSHGLYVKGTILTDIEKGREALILVQNKVICGLSIGFKPVHFNYQGHVRVIKAATLFEISLVTFPANPLAHL